MPESGDNGQEQFHGKFPPPPLPVGDANDHRTTAKTLIGFKSDDRLTTFARKVVAEAPKIATALCLSGSIRLD